MTNSKLIAACFTILAAAACAKEGAQNNTIARRYEPVAINGKNAPESKTHIGAIEGTAASIYWSEGDALSLFSTNSGMESQNTCIPSTSVNKNEASFYGEVEDGTTSFVALYPYNASASYSDGVISTVLPATQTSTNGSFAEGVCLALASGTKTAGVPETSDLYFDNLCSILSFTMPSNIGFANKVTVKSKSGAKMAGNVTVNCSSSAITSASSDAVVLSGSFVAGGTYYLTVAPGTYADGFSFAIETAGGNSYSRETTKTVEAAAGRIYTLGTLSLALGEADITSSIAISHNISGGELSGSTAKFSLTMGTSEFSSIATIKSVSVSLYTGSTEYRTFEAEGASFSEAEMTVAEGLPYIPKGDYNYDVTVNYTVNNGSKDIDRTVTLTGKTASSPVPSGLSLDAYVNGYTSYSAYKGTDGQAASTTTANGLDGSTIYSISATYKSGLSTAVYTQCSSLLSIASTLDGTAASGNKGSQDWAAHTLGAKMTFDGAENTAATTRTVYVTGLPISYSGQSYSGWSISASKNTSGTYSLYNSSYMTSCRYPVPESTNLQATIAIGPSGGTSGTIKCNDSSTQFSSSTSSVTIGTSISSSPGTLKFTLSVSSSLRFVKFNSIKIQYK